MVEAVVVTETVAYNLWVEGNTRGLVRVIVEVNAAVVVEGVTALTGISRNSEALVPSQIQIPTRLAALAEVMEVEQAFT